MSNELFEIQSRILSDLAQKQEEFLEKICVDAGYGDDVDRIKRGEPTSSNFHIFVDYLGRALSFETVYEFDDESNSISARIDVRFKPYGS